MKKVIKTKKAGEKVGVSPDGLKKPKLKPVLKNKYKPGKYIQTDDEEEIDDFLEFDPEDDELEEES